MKINSINILSFGKLKNVKIDFTDNLNIIYGDNEAGKTHIAEFIKLMFYGNGTRGQGVNNNRKKYKPWDDAKMGGSIDFTSDNKRYRLEREFKASSGSDNVILHDLDTGSSQTISGNENIGARFFGMSVSAFEQSVFIDNSVVFSGKGDDGELNMKLANLMNSADEDVSFDKIVKNITDAKETLISKNSKKGPIPELEAKLSALAKSRMESAEIYRTAKEKGAELDALKCELSLEMQKKADAFEKLRQFNTYSLKKQLTEFKSAVDEYESAEKLLTLADGSIADAPLKTELEGSLNQLITHLSIVDDKLRECDRDTDELAKIANELPSKDGLISALQDKRQSLRNNLDNTDNKSAELSAKIALLKTKKEDLKDKPNFILLIIGALLTLLGVGAGFAFNYLFVFAAVGIINVILGMVIKTKPDYSAIEKEISELENSALALSNEKETLKSELTDTDKQINDYIIKANTNSSLLETKKQDAIKKRAEAIALNNEVDKEKANVFEKISKFKPVYDVASAQAALKDMAEALDRLNTAKIKADAAVSHTGCRTTAEALEKLNALPDVPEITETRAELDENFRKIQENCSQFEKRISGLEAEIKATTSGVRTPAEFERESAEISEQLLSMREFTSSADIALSVLNDAYALQRRSWGSALENRVLSIFSGLTGGAYSSLSVSKDFELTVKAENDITSHSIDYLSKGTIHQAYFALRLALSEFLCADNGSLPVILDDIFSQYDDTRTSEGFKFLAEYAKENQVIFFTCHKELKNNSNANVISL